MGELTRCNWCTLRAIRQRASREHKLVTIVRNARWGLGGLNVYVHPAAVDGRAIAEDTPEHKAYFAAWFMALGRRCEC